MAQRPRPRGVTVLERDRVSEGYTLYSTLGGRTVFLIDLEGKIVHRWEMEYTSGDYGCLLDNGNLLYGGKTDGELAVFGGKGGQLVEVDWEGREVWRFDDEYMHHDFSRMATGNTMTLRWENVPEEKIVKIKGGQPGTEHDGGVMWADAMREITPAGEPVWEWRAHEHLSFDDDVICPLCKRAEWGHINSCNVLPDGNILTCFRVLDSIGIIDYPSGAWLWRWGRGELGHPHDPTLLDNGNILVFDNGHHTGGLPRSRLIEVNPKTDEIVWTYEDDPPFDFWSFFISGAQRLPNGNTMVCEGMRGRLFEITSDGELVWEFHNPQYVPFRGAAIEYTSINMVFRAYRYTPDHPALHGRGL